MVSYITEWEIHISKTDSLTKVVSYAPHHLAVSYYTGMRKFRIDQDFLIEHCYMIYIMPVVFAEFYFWMKFNSILLIN